MLRSKILLLFLLKAVIIYGFFSLPFSVYDEAYGSFYRKVAGDFFSTFRETGFVKFRELNDPAYTHLDIGNNALVNAEGYGTAAGVNTNTRYLGYIPTILLISLVLASPVSWRRRLIALAAGLIPVTLLIIFKQWISLLWLCEMNPWLQLTHFTTFSKTILAFTNTFISSSPSTVLYFVVAIWLLVTFRVEDFKTMPKSGNGS